jgi:hypothetical protein
MAQCDLDKVSSGAPAERDEIITVVAGLTEQVAHLTLQVKRLVAIADARRKRSALQRRRKRKTAPQAELNATSAATTCDVQAVEIAEAMKFPLLPQQDSCTESVIRGETDLIGDLTAQLEAAFPQSHDTNCPEENAIAARVADLHERLGGFVKSSLQLA